MDFQGMIDYAKQSVKEQQYSCGFSKRTSSDLVIVLTKGYMQPTNMTGAHNQKIMDVKKKRLTYLNTKDRSF
jgi:hypothetical protein